LGVFHYGKWRIGSGVFPLKGVIVGFLLDYIFVQHDNAEVIARKFNF
jgi:hypothetical protein